MNKLILLIQSQADVAALPKAAQAVKQLGVKGVWCIFTPAVTVDEKTVAEKYDTEIQQLLDAEKAAAGRSDYEAASGYKSQREGKILDRATAIRNAWKQVPEDQKKARIAAMIDSFVSVANPDKAGTPAIKFTGHTDDFEGSAWVSMLNSMSASWFAPFTPGTFSISWPTAFAEVAVSPKPVSASKTIDMGVSSSSECIAPKTPAPVTVALAEPKVYASREDELKGMKYMSLKSAAKKVGIEVEGKKVPQIIQEILAAESNLQPA